MTEGGYRGKILRMGLSTDDINGEALPDESTLRKYAGNFGLSLWYLMKELLNGVDALGSENPLIFMNGPLVRVRVQCSIYR